MDIKKYSKFRCLMLVMKRNSSERSVMFYKHKHYYNTNTYSIEEYSRRADLLAIAWLTDVITEKQWHFMYRKYVTNYHQMYLNTNYGHIERANKIIQ